MRRALALVALLAVVAGAADAEKTKAVKADDELPSDHGLLLFTTSSNQPIKGIDLVRIEGGAALGTPGTGTELELNTYRLKAGEYRLEAVTLQTGKVQRFKADDPTTPRFTIVAGAFNYAGDLHFKLRQDGIKVRTSGNSLDLIALLARRSSSRGFGKDDEFGPFRDRPFAVSGALAQTLVPQLKTPPLPGWKLEDWLANAPLPTVAEQLEVVNALLAKSDIGALKADMTRKELATLFEKLPEADGKYSGGGRGDDYLWLAGIYGYEGYSTVARLVINDGTGKLERVYIRQIDGWGYFSAPSREVWQDIKGFVDAKQD